MTTNSTTYKIHHEGGAYLRESMRHATAETIDDALRSAAAYLGIEPEIEHQDGGDVVVYDLRDDAPRRPWLVAHPADSIVIVDAEQYEGEDDCLAAAARDVAAERGLDGWDLAPRWEDDQRRRIVLTVPRS